MSDELLNISLEKASRSSLAISAILAAIYSSLPVLVGDLKYIVSEIIAAQRMPAISAAGLIFISRYKPATIVAVLPTASFLK